MLLWWLLAPRRRLLWVVAWPIEMLCRTFVSCRKYERRILIMSWCRCDDKRVGKSFSWFPSRGKVDADLNCSKKSFPLIVQCWLIYIVRRLCEGPSQICFTFFGLTVFVSVWFQVNCEHLEGQWRWGWWLPWLWSQWCKLFTNFRAFTYLHISHLSFPDTTIITIGACHN